MKAELCPVCKGEGKYKGEKCHGCDGKGWVEVRENNYPDKELGYPDPWQPWWQRTSRTPYDWWQPTFTTSTDTGEIKYNVTLQI